MTLKTWLCGNGNTEWNTKHPHRSIHEFICILITLRTSLTISGLSLRIMQNLWDLSRMQQSSYPVSTLTPMQKFLSQDMCALCLSSIQPGLLYKFGDQRWPRMASVTAKDSELDNSYRPRVPHTTWVIGQKRPVDIDKMFWCHFVILGVLVSYHRSSPRPRAKQTSQGDLRSAWQCRVVQHGTKVTTLQGQHLHSSSTIVPAPRLLSHPHAMWRLTPRVYTLIKILKLRAHCPKHCLEKKRWDLFVVINTVCYLPQIWIPPGIASNCSSTVKPLHFFQASNTYSWPLCVLKQLWTHHRLRNGLLEHSLCCAICSPCRSKSLIVWHLMGKSGQLWKGLMESWYHWKIRTSCQRTPSLPASCPVALAEAASVWKISPWYCLGSPALTSVSSKILAQKLQSLCSSDPNLPRPRNDSYGKGV